MCGPPTALTLVYWTISGVSESTQCCLVLNVDELKKWSL